MGGYDWEQVAHRVERENADLRRQLEHAWQRINSVYEHAHLLGVEVGEDALRDHAVEIRAYSYINEAKAHDLDNFRRAIVMIGFDAEDALKKGADPTKLVEWMCDGIRKHNEKARNEYSKDARERALREFEEAQKVVESPMLFELGGVS